MRTAENIVLIGLLVAAALFLFSITDIGIQTGIVFTAAFVLPWISLYWRVRLVKAVEKGRS